MAASIFTTREINKVNTDTIRGLACILLVSYHASVDALVYSGHTSEWLAWIHSVLAPIRMPLFSFLSGIVYAARPFSRATSGPFFAGKFRRLVVPFLTLTVIMLAMKTIYPSSSSPVSILDLPHYLIYGYSHLWFLQAIAIVFLIYALLDSIFAHKPNVAALTALALGAALYFSPLRQIEILSFGQTFLLLPFFALGVSVSRWWKLICSMRYVILIGCFAGLILGLVVGLQQGSLLSEPYESSPSFFVGFFGVMLLFLLTPTLSVLSSIGAYSFTIFLFHSIFTALAVRVGPSAPYALVIFAFFVSLLGPMMLERFTEKYAPIFNWVLGKRSRRGTGKRVAAAFR